MKEKFTFYLHSPLSDTCLPFYGRTIRGRNRIARPSVNRAPSANGCTPHIRRGSRNYTLRARPIDRFAACALRFSRSAASCCFLLPFVYLVYRFFVNFADPGSFPADDACPVSFGFFFNDFCIAETALNGSVKIHITPLTRNVRAGRRIGQSTTSTIINASRPNSKASQC